MPYEGEYAQYRSLRRLVDSRRVTELLSSYRVRNPSGEESCLQTIKLVDLPSSNWMPDWVIAVDGSYAPISVKNGFPGAEACYITVASVLLDLAKVRELDEHRPVDPREFRKVQDAGSIDWALPGCNIVYSQDDSTKASFRKSVFELFSSHNAAPDGETLLQTYESLLESKPDNREQQCPIEDCPLGEQGKYKRGKGTYKCICHRAQQVYSTDALRFHERMDARGANGAIYSEVLQVLERVWIIHILRMMIRERWLSALRSMAIVLDGPLAVFGQPAWISQAISRELYRLNNEVRETNNGQDILLLGIEKTGQFVDHFENLDRGQENENNAFPAGSVALLDDLYIKRNIAFSQSTTKFHGEDTYFGRVFFYKTSSKRLVVAMLPFLEEYHKDRSIAQLEQYPRIRDAISVIEQLVSSRYPNALAPIVAAHAEAAIPLHLGNKVLQRLAQEKIQNERPS